MDKIQEYLKDFRSTCGIGKKCLNSFEVGIQKACEGLLFSEK